MGITWIQKSKLWEHSHALSFAYCPGCFENYKGGANNVYSVALCRDCVWAPFELLSWKSKGIRVSESPKATLED